MGNRNPSNIGNHYVVNQANKLSLEKDVDVHESNVGSNVNYLEEKSPVINGLKILLDSAKPSSIEEVTFKFPNPDTL